MNLSIRKGVKADIPAIRDIINHYIVETAVTFDMEEASLENRQEWFKQFDPSGRHQLIVAEADGALAGYASSVRFHERPAYQTSVMTSVYLSKTHLGQGIGETLYRVLLAALEKTGIVHRAYALVVIPNPASAKLHEKLGFQATGVLHEAGYKLDRYHDVRIYERRFE
jgi:phosphinothricin acetyltransferase